MLCKRCAPSDRWTGGLGLSASYPLGAQREPIPCAPCGPNDLLLNYFVGVSMKRNLAVFFAVVVMILAALVGIQMRLPRVAWTRMGVEAARPGFDFLQSLVRLTFQYPSLIQSIDKCCLRNRCSVREVCLS